MIWVDPVRQRIAVHAHRFSDGLYATGEFFRICLEREEQSAVRLFCWSFKSHNERPLKVAYRQTGARLILVSRKK